MSTLEIDIETFSDVDLKTSGLYKYIESPNFTVLLFAYSWNDEPVKVIDLACGETIPGEIISELNNPDCEKSSYNANFEINCLSVYLKTKLPPEQWSCTMVKASMLGLPQGLDLVSKALKLKQQKDSAGNGLIRFFSIPCKSSKVNGGRTRNLPEHAPDKWQAYKDYNKQDVVVEKEIKRKINFYQVPDTEKKLWAIDQQINSEGVLIDPVLVNKAIQFSLENNKKLTEEAVKLTSLANPNSTAQLKKWLSEELEEEIEKLRKDDIPDLLKKTDDETVKRVLAIRQEMNKTSVKKYARMLKGVCKDNRLRGLLQYYGASRTGRWAGRHVQIHNLPKNHLKDLDLAREVVKGHDLDTLEMLYGNVPDTLSQLIRTSFVAPPGHRFICADFSAIEARVLAWLANERWRLNVFNTHGKIYEASAAQMFKVPIETVTKGSPLRQKGKVAELALGYQGGPNALIKMGALKEGLSEDELPRLVSMWRTANPAIVKFWERVQNAAFYTLENGTLTIEHHIMFYMVKGSLWIKLPSGRNLCYLRPSVREGKYGPAIYYEGVDQETKKWGLQQTYGGKLTENIVQAIARDCLAYSMLNLHNANYKIAFHVHDENVLDMPFGKGSCEEVDKIMSQPIPWAKGLPLIADSYETPYYQKMD